MNKPRHIELKVDHYITELVDEIYQTNDELLLDTVLDYYDYEEILNELDLDDIIRYVDKQGVL